MTTNVDQPSVASGAASPVGEPEQETVLTSRNRLVLRRFLRSPSAVIGVALVAGMFALAFLAPLVSPWGVNELDYSAFLQGPSADHWFGTTQIGADLFVQTMTGLQVSLIVGLLVGLMATALAAVVGAAAGYFGGLVDRSLMWVVDLMLVLPTLLIIAILSPAFSGSNYLILVVLLGAFSWMIAARIVRGLTLSLREREFVKAAKYMGVPPWKIIFRHILPNMSSLLIVDATIGMGLAILGESTLSFFGFGIQPPDVSLGTLIASGLGSSQTYPWLFLFPAGFLVLAVLSFNLVGDGLRDALDSSSDAGRGRRERRAAKRALKAARSTTTEKA